MPRKKRYGCWLMVLMGALPLGVKADIQLGAGVYAAECRRCHRQEPADFKTPLAEMEGLLSSGAVRQHRFELTPQELRELMDYLSSEREDDR